MSKIPFFIDFVIFVPHGNLIIYFSTFHDVCQSVSLCVHIIFNVGLKIILENIMSHKFKFTIEFIFKIFKKNFEALKGGNIFLSLKRGSKHKSEQ